jgi:hypothetical protein
LNQNNSQSKYLSPRLLAIMIVVLTLFFGLRPKEWTPINNVQWLSSERALSFQHPSIAYVDDVQSFGNHQSSEDFSIQIVIAPENILRGGYRPILTIHGGDDCNQLTLWQWGASVIVMNGNDYDYSKKSPRLSAKDSLVPGELSLITVTSSGLNTYLYMGGKLASKTQNSRLVIPHTPDKMRLILGNSVYGKHSWDGEIYGVAMTSVALSEMRVKSLYDNWMSRISPVFEPVDDLRLLYTFNEGKGRLVTDETGLNPSLQLPSRLIVLQRAFLSPPWEHFRLNLVCLIDVLVNVIGFIPIGAVAYYWSRGTHTPYRRYSIPVTLAFCFCLSLGIESVQAWLPNRDSSLLDLVLNTCGAWLGITVFTSIQRTGKNK